jgi:Ca-activated chloride channel family protein
MRLVFCFLLSMPFVHAQKKVLGEITTKDTAKLSILGVYQDQFPKVSVVFRAEKTNGNPVFGLGINDMSVRENGDQCEVVSLREISQKKPINIGAVLDHSGSMQFDEKQLIDLGFNPYYDYDGEGNPIWPKGYKAPIDVAKTALISFVDQFNFSKDKMSVVGFSTKVDKILKLSDNKKKINKMINSMKADDLTAFFDALIEGMQQIRDADGLSVVVALTDGNDNRSKNGYEDVVKLSKELNIPVYLIGLGDVNADSLQMLADATNGEFFYAKSASALSDIYGKISSKLQAFYDMVYTSPNLDTSSLERTLEISFLKDGIHLITEEERFQIDESTKTYIRKKEEQMRQAKLEEEEQQELLLYGGILSCALLAGGLLFYIARKKKKPTLEISKVYPNPTDGVVHIEINNNEAEEGVLFIMDNQGVLIKQVAVTTKSTLDLIDLPSGIYMLSVNFQGVPSKAVKLIKQ